MRRLPPDERRTQLLHLAIDEFGSKGYDGASLESIARGAGVRKQTLLYYFPSKEDLFNACIAELADAFRQALEEGLAGPEEGWERIEIVIRAVFRLAEERPELMPLAREAARHSPEAVHQIAGELEALRKRALRFLERGMDEGVFRSQDPGLLLFTLYTAVVGSITEAGVLRAVAGRRGGRKALRLREEELIQFVRRALES